MRTLAAVILSLILSSASLWATSSTQEAPKTARQALMEMFFSKEPGNLPQAPACGHACHPRKIRGSRHRAAVFRARRAISNAGKELSDI